MLRARGIARVEDGAQVGKGHGGEFSEGDGLADLQVHRHGAVAHAAAILHRHERQEAQHLPGAALLLGGAERRGAEALQQALRRGQLGVEFRRRVRCALHRGLAQLGKGGGGALCGGLAALLGIGRGQDGEIALGQACGLGAAHGELLRAGVAHACQGLRQARLIGVQQFGFHRLHSVFGVCRARRNVAQRQGGVDIGAGEARGMAELAHGQPGARPLRVAGLQQSRHRVIAPRQQCGPYLGARRGELRRIRQRQRLVALLQPGAQARIRRRGRLRQRRRQV